MLQRAVQRHSVLRFASTTLPCFSRTWSILRLSTPVVHVPLPRGLTNNASAAVSRKPSRSAGHSTAEKAGDLRFFGLVSQWDDAHYGLVLPNPVAAGELLLTPGRLWAAAVKDAAEANKAPKDYVALVLESSLDFFDAIEEKDGLPRVINHEGTLAALRVLGRREGKGQLLLLTGPRSVGKSMMLQKVAKELAGQKRRVLYIDARQYGPDLTKGIVASLVAEPDFFEEVMKSLPTAVASSVIALAGAVVAPMTTAAVVLANLVAEYNKAKDAPAAAPPRLDVVLGAFFAACKAGGEYPVVFVDEANKAFKAASSDDEAKTRVVDVLDLFTRITKQEHEASIVLATSEHGLPFRLRALGYNTDHISKTVVAEEVPPAVMKHELMATWGCGEHLATALLSMYGGHVLHASAAVRELATSTAPASMEGIVAVGSVASAPALCLEDDTLKAADVPSAAWPEMRTRVTTALRALVEKGYVPLDSEKDKVAEIISLAKAGRVIPRMGTASGVPPRAWMARTPSGEAPIHLLVPSSHMMRLLIARKVFPRQA